MEGDEGDVRIYRPSEQEHNRGVRMAEDVLPGRHYQSPLVPEGGNPYRGGGRSDCLSQFLIVFGLWTLFWAAIFYLFDVI